MEETSQSRLDFDHEYQESSLTNFGRTFEFKIMRIEFHFFPVILTIFMISSALVAEEEKEIISRVDAYQNLSPAPIQSKK